MSREKIAIDLAQAKQVVQFWRDAGPNAWFQKNDAFDREFRARFLALHEAAAKGDCAPWLDTANGALALVILLDQFPRNSFRDTTRMYATDTLARNYADKAIELGHDQAVPQELRLFFYLPFAHSENLADQDRSLALHERIHYTEHAVQHRDIVRRFGRFPHRNAILGRATTPEEQAYLDSGGFQG